MDKNLLILLILFFASIVTIVYLILSQGSNLKLEKIKGSARYIDTIVDQKIEKTMKKNKKTAKFLENINKLLHQSSLKPFGVKLSFFMFLVISVLLAVYTYIRTTQILHNYVAAFEIAGFALITPYGLVSLEVSLKKRKLRKHLPNFFLVISSLFMSCSDTIEVLEAAIPRMRKPLKSCFKRFVKNYRAGKDTSKIIDDLKNSFDNEIVIKFIGDIENNLENGGDFYDILQGYIQRSYDNQKNYIERITENSGNITGIIVILFMFISILNTLRLNKSDFIDILIYHPYGQLTVDLVILIFYIVMGLIRYSLSFKDE